ncbi:MAG: flagellar operon protein YvyF [Clostridiaceae bacterium]|jgi:flagellar operon protein (TIGR03826 family)|nr:flagellar operon protein YvyF [Clostridiaceae bacterium]
MPEIRNCKICRRIFQYVNGPVYCPACKKIDEEEFEKVRLFLRDFPGATMREVTDNTGVSPHKISRWLREERLEVSENSPIALNCENCGVRIRSGRFCIECSKSLAREMMNAGRELRMRLGETGSKRSDTGFSKDDFGLYYKHRDEKNK